MSITRDGRGRTGQPKPRPRDLRAGRVGRYKCKHETFRGRTPCAGALGDRGGGRVLPAEAGWGFRGDARAVAPARCRHEATRKGDKPSRNSHKAEVVGLEMRVG